MTPTEARKRVEEELAQDYGRLKWMPSASIRSADLRLLLAENERMERALRAIRDEPLIEKGNRMDGTEVVMIVKSPRIHAIAEQALQGETP